MYTHIHTIIGTGLIASDLAIITWETEIPGTLFDINVRAFELQTTVGWDVGDYCEHENIYNLSFKSVHIVHHKIWYKPVPTDQ